MSKPWQDKETLERLYYDEQLKLADMSDKLGCAISTIRKWMNRYDLERRDLAEARALSSEYNPPPKPHIDTRGYEVFRNTHRGEHSRFYHHRLLAVSKYGFDAVCGKQVHHKNHLRWDNRESNIELVDASEHQTHHLNVKHSNKPMPSE